MRPAAKAIRRGKDRSRQGSIAFLESEKIVHAI